MIRPYGEKMELNKDKMLIWSHDSYIYVEM